MRSPRVPALSPFASLDRDCASMTTYNCEQCSKEFDTVRNLGAHVRREHVNTIFVGEGNHGSNLCGGRVLSWLRFKRYLLFLEKQVVQKTEVGFPCPLCNAVPINVRRFQYHIRQYHDLRSTVSISGERAEEEEYSGSDDEDDDDDDDGLQGPPNDAKHSVTMKRFGSPPTLHLPPIK
ncbi:uncharacterized protein BYT42DRAFT_577129 [Radiomyces spectabilis]|uniref:uncharacterized protein n=1 Tax=Radiomyces spectabilis TaxID=64574 RepID=UPI002220735B|nr:uncharacterized protein BYT42DRAFT_577129 [Radiomyces spectabilis]KAI8374647.1 hypothetical protein BYT42DRAFT_577129 [Radiomyces spectabilis]